MKLSRRQFMQLMGASGTAALTPGMVFAEPGLNTANDDVIVVVFLRGAADGLNIVPPYADPDYYTLRPTLGIPAPDSGQPGAALDLDGFFGLHPAMAPLLPVYQGGDLAVIQAVGSPSTSHSHFDSQSMMERGVVEGSSLHNGWFGRYLEYSASGADSVFRSVGIGTAVQASLAHDLPSIALNGIDEFSLQIRADQQQEVEQALRDLYSGATLLDKTSVQTLDAVNLLADADPARYPVENGAVYPDGNFGRQLMETGQMIRANIGLKAVAIDIGGWDTHQGEAATLERLLAELAGGLAAFHTDMGDLMSGISVITMTEFGRRAYQNGSGGCDHGHASFMLALGGAVNGGVVYHDWPTLTSAALVGPGDLAETIDYRTVLADLISNRTAGMPLEQLFPQPYSTDFWGVFG